MAGKGIVPTSKYNNETPVDVMLKDSKEHISQLDDKAMDKVQREMNENWIATVGDLRLLAKEKCLDHIELPAQLYSWLVKQMKLKFDEVQAKHSFKVFTFVRNLDDNGICWWIATHGKTRPWKNPHDQGLIKVTASSIMHDSKPPSAVVGRTAVRCVTKPTENSWFQIDFAPRKIRPTHYTLRHYISWDSEALRNWKFEASNDYRNWTCIRSHVDDSNLDAKGKAYTWDVDCNELYSTFRVKMTDQNSNKHMYLALSGFEIYGELAESSEQPSSKILEKKEFRFISNLDTNGVVYWLGTNKGTRMWENPYKKHIDLYFSSVEKNSDSIAYLVGREVKRVVTSAKKMSYMCIDLRNIAVCPTHYMLRHYSSFDTECLRNWLLQGSNTTTNGSDGEWVTLSTHKNDEGLNAKGQAYTWKLRKETVNGQYFTKFRLLQTGPNSNSHHYLACSGFDIYGSVESRKGDVERAQQISNRMNFKFQHDFDKNGILYYLGSRGGTVQWKNPMDAGLVHVTSSSIMQNANSKPISAVVGRQSVRCVTKPHPKSWIAISFKQNSVRPTHYTLRHYISWDTEALRYWNFEGSKDGKQWRIIQKHSNDQSLNMAGASKTWRVDCDMAYSHFRIYMTGRNSNDHWYLSCSGFEIYGDAFGPAFEAKPRFQGNGFQAGPARNRMALAGGNGGGTKFQHFKDLDENGLCYYLGTRGLTQPWVNPVTFGEVSLRSSGLMDNSAPLESVVGRSVERCVTKPVNKAWIVIAFHNYAIRPTAYTLRHYASWDTEALRNWRLLGSLDGDKWTTIREHTNDQSLDRKGKTHTWRLDCQQTYSMFKILQFDKNSNQHLYLALSGFEVYGDVVRTSLNYVWDTNPRHKSKYLEVDNSKGVVVDTCASDSCPWQTILSKKPFDFTQNPKQEFSILVEKAEKTTNSWRAAVGIAPESFECLGNKQWLGSQNSWGFIAGTGGKCFNVGKSELYARKWGTRNGDLVTCIADAERRSISFNVNHQHLGVAFPNMRVNNGSKFFPAVSMTAYGSRFRLVERVERVADQSGSIGKVNKADHFNGGGGARMNGGWDKESKTAKIRISKNGMQATNVGSDNTWQCVVAKKTFKPRGRHQFTVEIVKDTPTTNTWHFIVGVVPTHFNPEETAWLGSQNSWGYIAGTGGKCHNQGKSEQYGAQYAQGDRITVILDYSKRTIEFEKNRISQGVAFRDLNASVRPAVSFCGTGAMIQLHL